MSWFPKILQQPTTVSCAHRKDTTSELRPGTKPHLNHGFIVPFSESGGDPAEACRIAPGAATVMVSR
jgi:hypothetical protein